jgi:hypothetical protein
MSGPQTGSTRREFLARAVGLGIGAATFAALEATPLLTRSALAASSRPTAYPDIQFDIGNFIAPVVTLSGAGGVGVAFHFAPTYILANTYTLTRNPTNADSATMASALNQIEGTFPYSPSGVFTEVAYGLPYLARLNRATVAAHLPRLLHQPSRFALEEAVPSPTDVSRLYPTIKKQTFNVKVVIEANDLLVQFRSDSMTVLNQASAMFASKMGHLLKRTSQRLTFTQIGAPRKVANANNLPYATNINPQSPMWMGFADQQVSGGGPPQICTFAGNSSAVVTTAKPGDYFDNASVLHQSHVIEDLAQFYSNTKTDSETLTERCQYMFRSNPITSVGYKDQFTNGGGPAYIDNTFQGTGDALANAQKLNTFGNEPRSGHLANLQRSSRAPDGTPMHIRADGPGFDNMDVPDGSAQPKLQFGIYVPSADFFKTMRVNQANLDYVAQYGVEADDNGLERFITATRRQNYLVPPRRHRVFPLLEFHS